VFILKLNPDCIRDILIYIEDNSRVIQGKYNPVPLNGMLAEYEYPIEELVYHLQQLELDGLVSDVEYDYTGEYAVKDLTPDGHRFLANIRHDDAWDKTKEITRSAGGLSIQMLKNVSESVLTAIVKNKLGL